MTDEFEAEPGALAVRYLKGFADGRRLAAAPEIEKRPVGAAVPEGLTDEQISTVIAAYALDADRDRWCALVKFARAIYALHPAISPSPPLHQQGTRNER